MNPIPSHLQEEALRLRLEERMSLSEIARATGVSQSTLSVLLRSYPLTKEEVQEKNRTKPSVTRRKSHGEESKHHRAINVENLSSQQKGHAAEAAVRFRLAVLGYKFYESAFDGNKYDLIVEAPETRRLLKLQVRWASQKGSQGLPLIGLHCADGHHKRRRYREDECDFIVGYYLFNDTAYVYSWAEVANHKTSVTISEEHAERWDKLDLA